jgi:predicted AlkP superfamily pyrophosphatase or phosphodiesterase
MTLVVLGIDALDPKIINSEEYKNLKLDSHSAINTINSSAGEPSTHELWPTIITGLRPEEHGLLLNDGVSWDSNFLRYSSSIADYVIPSKIQRWVGNWILNNTKQDAFRTSVEYYEKNNISTLFDSFQSKPIGIPNYVTDKSTEDRENQLRSSLAGLFERDADTTGGHKSSDPEAFYELCMEMSMIRIARVRRALRSSNYELVFGYTSGLDLIGHVSYDDPKLQRQAYKELDEFVFEVLGDLDDNDELVIISDHGLQDGKHTDMAFISSTTKSITKNVNSVTDFYDAVIKELSNNKHSVDNGQRLNRSGNEGAEDVKQQLEDLGYM